MSIIKFLLILCVVSLYSGCSISSKSSKADSDQILSQQRENFDIHLKQLENNQFKKAAYGFEAIAQSTKKGPNQWASLFNASVGFLQIDQCQRAKVYLKQLLSNQKLFDAFKAPAYVQLHYAHTCLDETAQAIEALHKANSVSKNLSETARLVEVPGRLSILYIQSNNIKKALYYQNQALDGIRLLKASMKGQSLIETEVSKLFYIIGRYAESSSVRNLHNFLLALPYHQLYLTQSFIISRSRWPAKSKQELISLYEKLWQSYKKLPAKRRRGYKKQILSTLESFEKISKESKSNKLRLLSRQIIKKMKRRL